MAKTKKGRAVHGVFLLDKAQGLSSNAIMQRVKRLFNAQKAGHTGALDPLATGMLPICLGEATKFSQYLLDSDKRYRVTAKLGERTDTSDADGEIVQKRAVNCSENEILLALDRFRGEILQTPTMFSALKYQGKPLYYYARKGITIPREARPIHIFSLIFLEYQAPYLTLEIHCSKGTYIRTLIDDLGETLGCGAYVVALRRLAVGDFPQEKMMIFADLATLAEKDDMATLDGLLLPIDSAVTCLPRLDLSEEAGESLQFGRRLKLTHPVETQGQVRLYTASQGFIGMGEMKGNILQPKRLLVK